MGSFIGSSDLIHLLLIPLQWQDSRVITGWPAYIVSTTEMEEIGNESPRDYISFNPLTRTLQQFDAQWELFARELFKNDLILEKSIEQGYLFEKPLSEHNKSVVFITYF